MSSGTIAMIPARMGSQRLARKNLRELDGVSLIARAIRKCIRAEVFDEIWVNSEDDAIAEIAANEGVAFHKRPAELANDTATSEDFLAEFLEAHHCERVVQVHTIAPLLGAARVAEFVRAMESESCDVLLSCVLEQIESACEGHPINFDFDAKTNSQDLVPVQRITWSITGWRRATFLAAVADGRTATYAGRRAFFSVDRLEGLIVKTQADLDMAAALLPLAADDI